MTMGRRTKGGRPIRTVRAYVVRDSGDELGRKKREAKGENGGCLELLGRNQLTGRSHVWTEKQQE